jgi:hypothetical protein
MGCSTPRLALRQGSPACRKNGRMSSVMPVYSVYRGNALGLTSMTLTVAGGALGGPGFVWEGATDSMVKQRSNTRLKANTHRDTIRLVRAF